MPSCDSCLSMMADLAANGARASKPCGFWLGRWHSAIVSPSQPPSICIVSR